MTINDPRDDPQYRVSDKGYKPQYDRGSSNAIDPETVTKFHSKDDLDSAQDAHHHSLGTKHDQASPGDHSHNGVNSVRILKGVTITGSRAGGAALVSVIDALEKLGAVDNTVA